MRFLLGAAGLLGLLKLAIQLAAVPGYGIFRDELYYLACGRRLAWGYVEFPPLIAAVTKAMTSAFGDGLFGIRLAPALAGAALVVLTCLFAREFGGGRFAQVLAGMAVIAAPVWLLLHHFLSPNAFEPLFWMGCAWLFVRYAKTGDAGLWLWFGLVAGVGLMNKHSMLLFGFGLVAGMLFTPARAAFRERRLWLGGAIAFLIFLPHLVWQVREGFPLIEFLRRADQVKNYIQSPVEFFTAQAIMLHPLLLPLWLAGLWFLFSSAGRQWRPLGWAYVVVFGLLVLLHGKPYYLVPVYPMLLAAGAVLLERAIERRNWNWLKPATVAAVVAGGVVMAPLTLPVLPVETYIRYAATLGISEVRTERHQMGRLPQVYADMHGWENMAARVAEVYHALPPEERQQAVVFAQNYGEAGAIEYFAPRYGLPRAISGHNSYWLWGPDAAGGVLIGIGGKAAGYHEVFEDVRREGTITHPYAMPYESNLPIWVCRKPKIPLRQVWPRVKHFS
ncbi:MAG TPA: glycosyltransferase family 39 protein [Bryobacteraceae bacterium]|nr:glycosyltransferase family 39 protein [Bryobacteraceae bacterium]